jgi:hypothetical protein
MQTEIIEVRCQCGAMLSVHKPDVIGVNQNGLAQVTVIPTWSTDERKCPHCRMVLTPVFNSIGIGWQAVEVTEESKVIIPAMQIPQGLRVVGK